MEPYHFDLERIFLGDLPALFLLEIALRTAVMFFYTMFLLRLVGNRANGDITYFELVLIVSLGSAVGDPMFYGEVPLIHGMTVVTVIILLNQLLVRISKNHRRLEDIIKGNPQRLILDGRVDMEGISKAQISREELYMELRQAGIENLGQVHRAYMELDGKVSVFRFEPQEIRTGVPLHPEWYVKHLDKGWQKSPREDYYACYYCGNVEHFPEGLDMPHCELCGHQDWVTASQEGVDSDISIRG